MFLNFLAVFISKIGQLKIDNKIKICYAYIARMANIMVKFIKSLFSKKLDKADLELLAICESHRS